MWPLKMNPTPFPVHDDEDQHDLQTVGDLCSLGWI